jgi:hypothetical protein
LPLWAEKATLRGKLVQKPGGTPVIVTADGREVIPSGDAQTSGVLKDARLNGAEFELAGEYDAARTFQIGPIHTRSMHVHKDGKRLVVTYWCEVCAIRTYTPGICWCCQEETALDLKEERALQ